MQPGELFGRFEVGAVLGRGGMGEVWHATDTRLGRQVALKVLPADLADEPERRARLEREARLLGALNHPNIATLYGLEEHEGRHVLVMELVAGEGLDDLVARGAVPCEAAIRIAREIAAALEAAHAAGIVHRDLKPANVRIRPDGTVKVLDFGLAKVWEADDAAAAVSLSPTITRRHTGGGMILGTAAYMAPEQAKGAAVDRRADMWAFGVVLWEMLCGRRLFDAATVPEVLAQVLTTTPDLTMLPAATPPEVRRLLRRCLEPDPTRRWRDAGDAGLELAEALNPQRDGLPPGRRRPPSWPAWLLVAVAAGVAAWAVWWRPGAAPAIVQGRFTVVLPAEAQLVSLEIPGSNEGPLAVTPDGSRVVYAAPRGDSTRLCLRAMDDPTPRELPGTEGARHPFLSPDGRWVAFFAGGKLRKAPLAGGTPTIVAEAPAGQGGSWGADGEIVFAPSDDAPLLAVSDSGGSPRRVTSFDFATGDDSHRWPQLLPDGRSMLFVVQAWSRETTDLVLVDLATGERRQILPGVAFARYLPSVADTGEGHLLFVRGGALVAARFGLRDAAQPAAPVVVCEGVRDGQFDVAANGTLVFVSGSGEPPTYSLVWADRAGRTAPIVGQRRGYEDLHLAPDGRLIAVTIEDAGPESAAHVWLADTVRGTLTRLTFEGLSRDPVWAPDGRSVVFGSKRGESDFGIYRQRVDGGGPAELVWQSPVPIWPDPQSWTPDGRTVVFVTKAEATGDDIWVVDLEGDRAARPWLATPAAEWSGRLSPDGRYLAYTSNESGRNEVYVRSFPQGDATRLVSQGGGLNPIWSRDGRELFYRRGGDLFSVAIETEGGFTAGQPALLFSGRSRETGRDFDISPDGSRFVMMWNDEPRVTGRFEVILDSRQMVE